MFPITWNVSVLKGVGWLLLGVDQMEIEKQAVGFSLIFGAKKGYLWGFLQSVCNQTTLSLKSTSDTPNNDNTSDSDTDTPFMPDTAVSSFSGSGFSWFDNGHIPNTIVICWLPDWFLNRESGIRRRVFVGYAFMGERNVNFLICWLPDRYINRDEETPIDGHKSTGDGDGLCIFQITDINIHLSIDQSINWSINWQKKRTEEHISKTADIRTHFLTDISTETRRHLSTDKDWRTGRVYFQPQTSILTHRLIDIWINWSIYQQTNKTDGGANH